ncbi:MAG: septal ring lytic transglycosylase RlpA family protein [Helicobacter sp.]|nr:septal ring lytic transglycosylase RlpA family protein [Helicobacter sp.]
MRMLLRSWIGSFAIVLFITACTSSPNVPVDAPSSGAIGGSGSMKPYQINGKWYYPSEVAVGTQESGLASWYGPDFHGRTTSNGESYNMHAKTAAHKTFPMNTIVKVTNQNNGLSTVVRINDRGPFVEGRVIDLSQTGAQEIDMIKTGTAPVVLEVLGFNGVISNDSVPSLPQVVVQTQEFPIGKVQSSMPLGRFLVQIGAFRREQGAQTFKNANSHFTPYTAVVREFELNGAPIYRVMLSGFNSADEARDFISSHPQLKGAFTIAE